MEINNNSVIKYIKPQVNFKKNIISQETTNNITSLPNTYSAGVSSINSNLPVSYTKIGEIDVPGLKDKASVFKLANGQKVIICPKKGQTVVRTTYNVGSMNETEDIRGISHYIEHNLFNGSKDLQPKEYDKNVNSLGGNTNAGTSYNKTSYFIDLQLVKENSLEQAINLNANLTQFPTFQSEQLEKEKGPVKSEIDQYKDDASSVAYEIALNNLFNINTKASCLTLGTKDNINSFTREKVLDYFNTWYTPDNAVTVITGDIDTNEAINLVSKYFNKPLDLSNINKRHSEPIQYTDKPIRNDIISPNANFASITTGFAIPEGTSKEELSKLDILIELLQSGNSKLSKKLDNLGTSINIYLENIHNKPDSAKALLISCKTEEEKVEDVLKIIYEEITDIINNPPSYENLENIKNKTVNNINNCSETSQELNYILSDIALNNDFNYFNDRINNIKNLTPLDISETAKKFLDLNKISICVSHDKNSTNESINQNYKSGLNSNTISFGKSLNPLDTVTEETQKIKKFRLINNIETMGIQGSSNGKSCISIDMKTDELNNIPEPAFEILNELLNRGSAFNNNDTYKQIKENKQIATHIFSNSDGLLVTASFNDENIKDSLSLIKETLTYPNFTQDEFERAKKLIKDEFLSSEDSAFEKLLKELHPSIKANDLKEEKLQQLDKLTLQDIQNLYSLIISTSKVNATIIAPLEEKPYLTDIFNNELSQNLPVFQPVQMPKSQSYNIYSPNTEAKILTVPVEQTQAEILQAYKYKKPENVDDIAKIELLNNILGGAGNMSSRLFTDLRENKKLAYHTGSEIISKKDTSAIILDISTTTESPDFKEGSPENAKTALEGFERNINLLKNSYVSQDELEHAKIKYKTDILNNLESNIDKISSYILTTDSPYGINYYQELLNAIDRVTVEDIKAAANYIFANPPITSIAASKNTLKALNLI